MKYIAYAYWIDKNGNKTKMYAGTRWDGIRCGTERYHELCPFFNTSEEAVNNLEKELGWENKEIFAEEVLEIPKFNKD